MGVNVGGVLRLRSSWLHRAGSASSPTPAPPGSRGTALAAAAVSAAQKAAVCQEPTELLAQVGNGFQGLLGDKGVQAKGTLRLPSS